MKTLGILSVVSVMIAFSTGVKAENCKVTITTGNCPDECVKAAKMMCEQDGLEKCMAKIRERNVPECAGCAPESIDVKCE